MAKKKKTEGITIDVDLKYESTLKAFVILLEYGVKELQKVEKMMKKGDTLKFINITLDLKISKKNKKK